MSIIKKIFHGYFLLGVTCLLLTCSVIFSISINAIFGQLDELKHEDWHLAGKIQQARTAIWANAVHGDNDRSAANFGSEKTFIETAHALTAQGLLVHRANAGTVTGSGIGTRHVDMQFFVSGNYPAFKKAVDVALAENSTLALERLQITKQAGSSAVVGDIRFRLYGSNP